MAGTSPSNPVTVNDAEDPNAGWQSKPTSDELERIFRSNRGYTMAERAVELRSWVWLFGVDIQNQTERRWVCLPCVRKKTPKPTTYDAKGTQNMENHLWKAPRRCDPSGKRKAPSQIDKPSIATVFNLDRGNPSDQAVANKFIDSFDKKVFQRLLVSWIVDSQQSFRTVEDPRLRAIFRYLNPSVAIREADLSHQTVRMLVIDAHAKHMQTIKVALRQAVGKIHIC